MDLSAPGLILDENVTEFYFNLDVPDLSLLSFEVIDVTALGGPDWGGLAATDPLVEGTHYSLTEESADGFGIFDVKLDLPPPTTAGLSDRLQGGETLSLSISYSGVDLFDKMSVLKVAEPKNPSSPDDLFAGAKIQTINGEDSGWISGDGITVPEPGTYALFAGVAAMVVIAFRRRR